MLIFITSFLYFVSLKHTLFFPHISEAESKLWSVVLFLKVKFHLPDNLCVQLFSLLKRSIFIY